MRGRMNQELERFSVKQNSALIAAAVMRFHLAFSLSAGVVRVFFYWGCFPELTPTKTPLP